MSVTWFNGGLWAASFDALATTTPIQNLAVWNGTTWARPPRGAIAEAALIWTVGVARCVIAKWS